MRKKVQWRQAQKCRRVRQLKRRLELVLQLACPCCDSGWVDSVENDLWDERRKVFTT
jgi:hypothetical protein